MEEIGLRVGFRIGPQEREDNTKANVAWSWVGKVQGERGNHGRQEHRELVGTASRAFVFWGI